MALFLFRKAVFSLTLTCFFETWWMLLSENQFYTSNLCFMRALSSFNKLLKDLWAVGLNSLQPSVNELTEWTLYIYHVVPELTFDIFFQTWLLAKAVFISIYVKCFYLDIVFVYNWKYWKLESVAAVCLISKSYLVVGLLGCCFWFSSGLWPSHEGTQGDL